MNNEQRINTMRERINNALNPSQINIIDDSQQHIGHAGAEGGAGHFTVEIASPSFADKSRVQCHRLVYDAVGDLMDAEVHALSIKIIK